MSDVGCRNSEGPAARRGRPAPVGALAYLGGEADCFGIVAGEVLLPEGIPAWLVRVPTGLVWAVLPACLIVVPRALLVAGALPAPGGMA